MPYANTILFLILILHSSKEADKETVMNFTLFLLPLLLPASLFFPHHTYNFEWEMQIRKDEHRHWCGVAFRGRLPVPVQNFVTWVSFSNGIGFESSHLKVFGSYSGLHLAPVKAAVIKSFQWDGNPRICFLLGFERKWFSNLFYNLFWCLITWTVRKDFSSLA